MVDVATQLPRISLLTVVLFASSTSTVFAQEEIDFGRYIEDGLDFFGEFGTGAVDESGLDEDTKGKLENAIEEGIPVAKKGIDFWTSLHHYIVGQIFNNSPIPISLGIASIISLGLIGFMIWRFLRHTFKLFIWLVLIAIGIFMVFVALGIEIGV